MDAPGEKGEHGCNSTAEWRFEVEELSRLLESFSVILSEKGVALAANLIQRFQNQVTGSKPINGHQVIMVAVPGIPKNCKTTWPLLCKYFPHK